MAEVQDEDQWLYGDDKEESTTERPQEKSNEINKDSETVKEADSGVQDESNDSSKEKKDAEMENKKDGAHDDSMKSVEDKEQNGEKKDGDDDSSSDDEATVTIGKIVKQPDIIRPPPQSHRAAPTSGLKDDDFSSVGKINGVTAVDFNLQELEDKPWRKPGADLSDYFNYGFTEDTWFKYCERQKTMRNNESGVGLTTLGINLTKPLANLSVSSSANEYNKPYQPKNFTAPPLVSYPNLNSQTNTIQVMTAERRTYSNKVLNNLGGYDDMDFGGVTGTGAASGGYSGNREYFNSTTPGGGNSSFFNTPPPTHGAAWTPNVPPPNFSGPPPPVTVPVPYYEERTTERRSEERELDTTRSREPRDRERHRDRSRDRERSRERSSRRSRSRSRTRHSRRRSRSRSPTSSSHRHKRKKIKKERLSRERSKSR